VREEPYTDALPTLRTAIRMTALKTDGGLQRRHF
jgi:hypothetical protein